MRGREQRCGELFSYVDIEARIRADHPLRTIKVLVGEALDALSGDSEALICRYGGTAVDPAGTSAPGDTVAGILFGTIWAAADGTRLEFDLLFRWFVGLSSDERSWDASTVSKNRERFLGGDIAAKFLAFVLAAPGYVAAVNPALRCRRHSHRGIGRGEELSGIAPGETEAVLPTTSAGRED